jgi:hypothetical protein
MPIERDFHFVPVILVIIVVGISQGLLLPLLTILQDRVGILIARIWVCMQTKKTL